LAALGQLVPVHIPQLATREHRWLIKYRKTIVGRINRTQNILRALYQQHGLSLPMGARCWTIASLDAMQQQSKPLAECDRRRGSQAARALLGNVARSEAVASSMCCGMLNTNERER
jgi:hypothetical protein